MPLPPAPSRLPSKPSVRCPRTDRWLSTRVSAHSRFALSPFLRGRPQTRPLRSPQAVAALALAGVSSLRDRFVSKTSRFLPAALRAIAEFRRRVFHFDSPPRSRGSPLLRVTLRAAYSSVPQSSEANYACLLGSSCLWPALIDTIDQLARESATNSSCIRTFTVSRRDRN